MASINKFNTTLSHVINEGDLLPFDILQKIVNFDEEIDGLNSVDYGLVSSEKIPEFINRSWQRLLNLWPNFFDSLI